VIQIIRQALELLDDVEKRNALKILVLLILVAILEMIGAASIMPFMAVVAIDEISNAHPLIQELYSFSNARDLLSFQIYLGFASVFLLLFSVIVRSLSNYLLTRYIQDREASISSKLVSKYINKEYLWHVNNGVTEISKIVLSEVNLAVQSGISPLLNLAANFFIAIGMISIMLLASPELAVITFSIFSLIYLLFYLAISGYVENIGRKRIAANKLRFKIVKDVFSSIKEVKIYRLAQYFRGIYQKSAYEFAKYQAHSQVASTFPRYLIELFAFGSLILIILYMLLQEKSITYVLPVLSLYAISGYKLLPSMQIIYGSIVKLRYAKTSLDKIASDIREKDLNWEHETFSDIDKPKNLSTLEFRNITFSYGGDQDFKLHVPSLKLRSGKMYAVVGPSGCGKSTFLDILTGLIMSKGYDVRVNGVNIYSKSRLSYLSFVSYAPQFVSVIDDTIVNNITLGEPACNEDFLNKVIRIVGLDKGELSRKIKENTAVGENGAMLSGGQRQRLGIARALYRNRDILVLDESTSAIDPASEKEIVDRIREEFENMLIILVAHREESIRLADYKIYFDNGTVSRFDDS